MLVPCRWWWGKWGYHGGGGTMDVVIPQRSGSYEAQLKVDSKCKIKYMLSNLPG